MSFFRLTALIITSACLTFSVSAQEKENSADKDEIVSVDQKSEMDSDSTAADTSSSDSAAADTSSSDS
ncbi:MAG: hypothetical protein ACLFQB_14735, partial [Chitinispirillaceae bacterium]